MTGNSQKKNLDSYHFLNNLVRIQSYLGFIVDKMYYKVLHRGIFLFLLPALWIKSVDWFVVLSTSILLIVQIAAIFSYFTLIGSRTLNFGEDYKVYLTRRHDWSPTPLILKLEMEGKTSGDTIDHSIPLDFEEKFITFEVSE